MKSILAAGLAAASLVAASQPASAADGPWPDRNLRLIVPFAPGAAADMFGRLVGQKLGDSLGQQVVVENRAGGGAVVGTEIVARAAPDGYTLLLTTPAFVINSTGIRTLPYNAQKDFSPISLFASTAMIIVSNPDLSIRTTKDLIELAKKNPGKLTFGSAGNGSINQLGMELFGLQAAKMTHVAYKGGAPALADVAGGRVDVMLSTVIAAQPLMKAGRLRPIAVTTAARSALMPDVPTVAETLPGFECLNWAGLVAPAQTPAGIVYRLNSILVKALTDPEVKERLAREGAEPVGSSPQQFETFIRNEIAKWTRVVKETGATID